MKLTSHILKSIVLALTLVTIPSIRADDIGSKPKGEAVKPYPLKICIVSGEKLEEMGKPRTLTYKGQEIKFCCKDCIKDFNKDPDKYLKKMAEEQKAK